MDTNLNLKGRVQIYNNDNGECVLDKHNAITDLGKRCILGRMTNLTDNLGKLFTKAAVSVMYFSYGTTSINNAVTINDLAASNSTDAKANFYKNFFKSGSWESVSSGLLVGSVKNYVKTPTNGIYEFVYLSNASGTVTIKFTDTGSSVSVDITDSNGSDIAPNPTSSAGCFSYNGDNSIVYYAYIKTGDAPTPELTGISLGSPNNLYSGDMLNDEFADSLKNQYCIIPFTGISFNLGALAKNSTYVIKYTLYM